MSLGRGDAYSDRQLTPKFELLSWNFLCANMFPYGDTKTVSVCPYSEKRNHHSFVNISPTLVNDTSMERSSRVLATAWKVGNPIFFLKGFEIEFWFVLKSWNHLTFVYICPTLVIDTSMERFSWVLASYSMETQKFDFFFSKKFEIEFSLVFWASNF